LAAGVEARLGFLAGFAAALAGSFLAGGLARMMEVLLRLATVPIQTMQNSTKLAGVEYTAWRGCVVWRPRYTPSVSKQPTHQHPQHHEDEPIGIIVGEIGAHITGELRSAIEADLAEVCGLMPLKWTHVPADAAALSKACAGAPLIVLVSADVLNPSLSLLESLPESLADEELGDEQIAFDASIGPAIDGSVWGVALIRDVAASKDIMSALAAAFVAKSDGTAKLAELMSLEGHVVLVHNPHVRAADAQSLRFAELHMRALAATDDPEFTSHRTQAALGRAHA
jgi:hypothetical protein